MHFCHSCTVYMEVLLSIQISLSLSYCTPSFLSKLVLLCTLFSLKFSYCTPLSLRLSYCTPSLYQAVPLCTLLSLKLSYCTHSLSGCPTVHSPLLGRHTVHHPLSQHVLLYNLYQVIQCTPSSLSACPTVHHPLSHHDL